MEVTAKQVSMKRRGEAPSPGPGHAAHAGRVTRLGFSPRLRPTRGREPLGLGERKVTVGLRRFRPPSWSGVDCAPSWVHPSVGEAGGRCVRGDRREQFH